MRLTAGQLFKPCDYKYTTQCTYIQANTYITATVGISTTKQQMNDVYGKSLKRMWSFSIGSISIIERL